MAGYSFGAGVMMQLGAFQFGIETAAYQELSRSTAWRWAAQGRIGQLDGQQFTGPDEETMTLPGLIYPEWRGGFGQLDAMRGMAGKGLPLDLTDGNGNRLGRWVIIRADETQSVFADAGRPRRVEFSLELRRFPDAPAETIAPATATEAAGVSADAPAGQSGAVAQVRGLAGSVSSAATSAASTLQRAADQVQTAVAPYTAVARETLGGVARALAAVGELQTLANRTLAIVGLGSLEISALNRAQNMAMRAAGLTASVSSASAMIRNSAARLEAIGATPAASTAVSNAQAAADAASRLVQQTAAEAGKIKG
ncbi:MAG: hypothetical protein DI569_12910 [Sphingopyxis macrogoltabida]|uniref:Phage tail protein n=1 Tax=Sphingopyxis macrogoltabida TaxID=33050 RepID=A0A2W5L0T9_SPHMC|nr:MAG: hypothetical protein DI569_12910 [Sphingopyxis macrogoltabida]